MPRTKRQFTKHNSTKFVLFTEGRNEQGEKIQQNVLVPVPNSHVAGSSLLFSGLAGACGPPVVLSEEEPGSNDNSDTTSKKFSETFKDEGDLEKILQQMDDSDLEDSDSEDDDFENIRHKMEKINFFQGPNGTFHPNSNMQIEIFEEGSEISGDFGQFSDIESDDEFDSFQTKSTLTCARSDCPESLKLLNEGFKKVFAEYESQVGALDDEEICGTFTTDNEHIINNVLKPADKKSEDIILDEFDEDLKKKILLYTEVEHPEKKIEIETKKPVEFDCESILSTYSNKYNRPTIIKEEKIRKIKIPNNPLKKGLTKSQLKQLDSQSESQEDEDEKLSVITSCSNMRIKGETPEQRRERKTLFKEAKRESRKLKKENKLAFKNEKKIQVAQAINIQNTKGIKLL